jgi:hypothetical protein
LLRNVINSLGIWTRTMSLLPPSRTTWCVEESAHGETLVLKVVVVVTVNF